MLKQIKLLLLILFVNSYLQIGYAEEKPCTWDNKNGISCLEIKSHISNTSKHSISGLNKIVISKTN